mgnify:CR=1 FL=1
MILAKMLMIFYFFHKIFATLFEIRVSTIASGSWLQEADLPWFGFAVCDIYGFFHIGGCKQALFVCGGIKDIHEAFLGVWQQDNVSHAAIA